MYLFNVFIYIQTDIENVIIPNYNGSSYTAKAIKTETYLDLQFYSNYSKKREVFYGEIIT